ncbi:hypothetical protein OIU77_004906 [Salix suchowensis]|uniref:Uncharacterized protein n=1 Tax=Salix suchowensis TaxID=1278906 RepID=A0ABQ9AX35_9ROSI|nr:hypothetical protein OIU77_004906 [Salix suchowensis]
MNRIIRIFKDKQQTVRVTAKQPCQCKRAYLLPKLAI